MRLRARFCRTRAAMAGLAVVLAAASAMADPDPATRAHDAYERGTAAYMRGDYAGAAREYATADALVPNAVTLQAALDAAVLADEPVLGIELVDRAARAPLQGALADLLAKARRRFAGRTGRVRVACGASPCLVAIDGAAVDAQTPAIVRVGPHTVTVQRGDGQEQRIVEVHADEVVVVGPAAQTQEASTPPRPPPLPETPKTGISPVWFLAGLGVTAVVGGASIASGVDTSNKHTHFVDVCVRGSGRQGCDVLAADGSSAQSRTNVLLAATAVLGVATVAVGIFAVRWRGEPRAVVSVGILHGVPAAALRIPF